MCATAHKKQAILVQTFKQKGRDNNIKITYPTILDTTCASSEIKYIRQATKPRSCSHIAEIEHSCKHRAHHG